MVSGTGIICATPHTLTTPPQLEALDFYRHASNDTINPSFPAIIITLLELELPQLHAGTGLV
jgi:hypothetical protein